MNWSLVVTRTHEPCLHNMIRTLAYPAKHSVKKTIRHMVLGPFIRVLPRKGRAGEVFASIGSWSSRIRSSASSWLWECIESMLTRFRSDAVDTDWWMLAGSLGPRSWLEPAIKTKFACLSFWEQECGWVEFCWKSIDFRLWQPTPIRWRKKGNNKVTNRPSIMVAFALRQ